MWLTLISSTALLYILPVSDPFWGDLVVSFRQYHAPLPVFITLSLLTFILGFPSKRELVASTVVGIFGGVTLTALSAVTGQELIGWFLIATFFLVLPLSWFLFRRLMLRGVADQK